MARIALVGAAGLALLALGWLRARREATPVNQVLAGTGLAGMYLATVAARTPEFCLVPEPLLSAGGAFALLGLISALGLATAVTIAAPAVALLALFGGQLALAVAPDSGSRHGLLIHQPPRRTWQLQNRCNPMPCRHPRPFLPCTPRVMGFLLLM